jgi:hypothetical protein
MLVNRFLLFSLIFLVACTSTAAESTPVAPESVEATGPALAADTPVPAATDTSPPPTDTPAPAPTDLSPPPTDTPQPAVPTEQPAASPTPEPLAETVLPETNEFGWLVLTIDSGTKPALVIDRQDRPHVVYMTELDHGYVKYAQIMGIRYTPVTVAEGYFYGPPAIDVGPDDRPYIVYHDHQDLTFLPEKGDAVLATLADGNSWDLSTIAHPGHDGWDNDIAIDSQGTIHTASVDPSQFGSQDGVEYAVLTETGWAVESIGSGPIAYEFGTDIAIDPAGLPGITYHDDVAGLLKYAHRDGEGIWTITTVDEDGNTGKFTALDFDGTGRPHISYFVEASQTGGTVRYAFWNGTAWQIEDVAQVTNVRQGFVGARHLTWLRLDSQDRPHVAFNDQSQLGYAVREEGGWQVTTVAQAGATPFAQLVVMDLDSRDRPHLVYALGTPPEGEIQYATLP